MASGRAGSATPRRKSCWTWSREYRKRKIPLDNIVMDWFYWKEDSWGSHQFDKTRFPDPKGMLDKVHAHERALHDFRVAEVLSDDG